MTQQRATRTRRTIIEAAAEVFDEHGYEAASTAEILSRGGLTRGALYFHFPSKATLADAVVATGDNALLAPERPVRLQSAIDLCLEYGRRLATEVPLRAATRLTMEYSSYRRPDSVPHDGLARQLRRVLDAAVHRGEMLPTADPGEITDLVMDALTGVELASREVRARPMLAHRVSVLWRYLLPSIAVPGVLPHLSTTGSG